MFQVLRKYTNTERFIYTVLQVDKKSNEISFLIEINGDLLWIDSSLFIPHITSEKDMPTFIIKETNRSQVFYAAIQQSLDQTKYDLLYYEEKEWKTISNDKCIIEASRRLK